MRKLLRFVRSDDGGSEMTVPLLLTAAGAAMVGLAVPKLYNASDAAGRTFDQQVQVLERGARTGSVGRGGAPTSGFELGGAQAAPNYVSSPTSVTGGSQNMASQGSVVGARANVGGSQAPITQGNSQLTGAR